MSQFDVNCRSCGRSFEYKSESQQWTELGFEGESTQLSAFEMTESRSEGGTINLLHGIVRALNAVDSATNPLSLLRGAAAGAVSGAGAFVSDTAKIVAADSGMQSADSYAEQKRIERAIRDSKE